MVTFRKRYISPDEGGVIITSNNKYVKVLMILKIRDEEDKYIGSLKT